MLSIILKLKYERVKQPRRQEQNETTTAYSEEQHKKQQNNTPNQRNNLFQFAFLVKHINE